MGTWATQTTQLLGRDSGWHVERVPSWDMAPQGIHSPGCRLEGVKESLSPHSTKGWAASPASGEPAGMPLWSLGNISLGGTRVPLGLYPQLPVAKALAWVVSFWTRVLHPQRYVARSHYPHLTDRETGALELPQDHQAGGAELGFELGPMTESPCFLCPPSTGGQRGGPAADQGTLWS